MIEGETFVDWFAWGSWAWIRVWAMLRVQPCWGRLLGSSWWFVAAASAVWLVVLASAHIPIELPPAWPGFLKWALRAVLEFALGSVWGWLVALPSYALIGAATETRNQLSGERGGEALVLMVIALGLGFGFALGVHHVAMASLLDSLNLVQVGAFSGFGTLGDSLGVVLRAARNVMSLSLALSSPVLLAAAVTDTVVFALGRAFAPNRDPTMLSGSWLRLALVLLALGASWLTFPYMWARAWA